MANYDYVTKGSVDGAMIGDASTEKIGFWGTTPCDQPATASEAAVTTSVTTTATTTQLASTVADIVVLLNQIRTDLVEIGIIKGSA